MKAMRQARAQLDGCVNRFSLRDQLIRRSGFNRHGVEVVLAEGEVLRLAHASHGREAEALASARANIDTWTHEWRNYRAIPHHHVRL